MQNQRRSNPQNNLYHQLCTDLKQFNTVFIWDGRFASHGLPNPFRINPQPFSYDTFRELLKAVDWEYEKDEQGRPLSSAKISVDAMNSHINFLECLLIEGKQ